MEKKIRFIEEAIISLKENLDIHLKIPELRNISPSDTLDYVREYRNNEYHSTSGSFRAQQIIANDLHQHLDQLLKKLIFLEEYRLCRVDSFFVRGGEWFYRVELFSGAPLESTIIEELWPGGSGLISNDFADSDRVIILGPGSEWLDLYPYYQIDTSPEFRCEPHICFIKQVKSEKLEGESIQFRAQVELSGFDYLERLMLNSGLKKG